MYYVVLMHTVFGKRQKTIVSFSSLKKLNDDLSELINTRNNTMCFLVTNKKVLNYLDEILTYKEFESIREDFECFSLNTKTEKFQHGSFKDIQTIEKLPSGMYLLRSDSRIQIVLSLELMQFELLPQSNN